MIEPQEFSKATITGTIDAIEQGDRMRAYGTVTSKQLSDAQVAIGLPSTFAAHLLSEDDDWSFIIKLHALIEAALTRALSEHFRATPAEEEVFARMSVGGANGKVRLARAAGLIDAGSAQFLSRLSKYRNEMVHRIDNVYFDLEKHVGLLDANAQRDLASVLALHIDEAGAMTNLLDNPRFAFIGAGLHVLERLVGSKAPTP